MEQADLKRELNRIPLRYTLPISCFCEAGIVSPGNATVTLVEHSNRFYCVTNEHVLRGIEDQIAEGGYCQIGNSRFDLIGASKFVDPERDLCCFEVNKDIVLDFQISGESPRFIRIAPTEIDLGPDQYVSFGGYPGCFRSKTKYGYHFDTFSHGGCLVTSVGDTTFSCRMERDFEEEVETDRRWDELTALGGISGCPVFTWVYDPIARIELIGVVQEGQLRIFGSENSTIIASKIDKSWIENAASHL